MKKILRLIGVYNANGTLLGELAYLIRKKLGIRDCVLCDITYRGFRKNKEWLEHPKSKNVELIYLNDRNEELREFTDQKTPCIVGQVKGGYVMVINKDELRRLKGNVQDFHKLLQRKLARHK